VFIIGKTRTGWLGKAGFVADFACVGFAPCNETENGAFADSKVHFYWQIEKSVGRNGRKSCNENVSKNALFVAGYLSIVNAQDKLNVFLRPIRYVR
jgi:hypothetical protein